MITRADGIKGVGPQLRSGDISVQKKLDKYREYVLILSIVEDCASIWKKLRQNALKSQITSGLFVHFDITCFSVMNTSSFAFSSMCFSYMRMTYVAAVQFFIFL